MTRGLQVMVFTNAPTTKLNAPTTKLYQDPNDMSADQIESACNSLGGIGGFAAMYGGSPQDVADMARQGIFSCKQLSQNM